MSKRFYDKSLYFTSLGCSKNLVDSQVMLGHLGLDGFKLTEQPEQAEVIIVNTCSFIEASKIESIETVLDLAIHKDVEEGGSGKCQALVMAGCMAQRYAKELEVEMPEVDLFIGTGEYQKIVPLLRALEEGKLEKKSFVEIPKYIHTEFDPRLNTGPKHMAWFKVSEGCNRNCTFCIIPTLRGKLRSRSVESLTVEAKRLVDSGVRELNMISQDLSDYGVDLPSGNQRSLVELLNSLEEIPGLNWIRLFYMYPDDLAEELMQTIKSSKKVCRYLDMPIQHFSSSVLKRMNRRVTEEQIYSKIARLRSLVPDIILRTSVIVGFPGETQEDFEKLLKGIKECRFHHLGVFKYSDEEGTPAYKLMPKVPQEIIDERFQQVYEVQKEIVRELNAAYLGQTLDVLVEGAHLDTDMLLQGRHAGQAPDIDGIVIINEGQASPGDFVKVKITEVLDYDLVGHIVP